MASHSKAEVVAWLAADPTRSALDAVEHWYPGLTGDARTRRYATIRQWCTRARAAASAVHRPAPPPQPRPDPPPPPRPKSSPYLGRRASHLRGPESPGTSSPDPHAAPAPATPDPPPAAPALRQVRDPEVAAERPPPRPELVALSRVDFLAWQLVELLRDIEQARASGAIRLAAQLDARVSEVREHLDQARGEAGRAVRLDRNPAAVAAEVARRAQQIDQLRRAAGAQREL